MGFRARRARLNTEHHATVPYWKGSAMYQHHDNEKSCSFHSVTRYSTIAFSYDGVVTHVYRAFTYSSRFFSISLENITFGKKAREKIDHCR